MDIQDTLQELLVGQMLILEILLTMESRVSFSGNKYYSIQDKYAIDLLEKHRVKVLQMLAEAREKREIE